MGIYTYTGVLGGRTQAGKVLALLLQDKPPILAPVPRHPVRKVATVQKCNSRHRLCPCGRSPGLAKGAARRVPAGIVIARRNRG